MKLSTLRLPFRSGKLEQYTVGPGGNFRTVSKIESRKAYAAAHVVADPLTENGSTDGAAIDWEATLRFREHLWSHGLVSLKRWIPRNAAWDLTGNLPEN